MCGDIWGSFIKRQTNDNEWRQVVQRVTTSGTMSDNERQRVVTSDNEWQRVIISAIVSLHHFMIILISGENLRHLLLIKKRNICHLLYTIRMGDDIWGSFIKRQTNGTSSDNELSNEWQRMTMSYNEWQRVIQRTTTRDNKWQWVTTNGNECYKEWQWVVILANFPLFQIREEHSKEKPLNFEEGKNKNKPLRRNINSKKKELRQYFLFAKHKTLKLYEDRMTQI